MSESQKPVPALRKAQANAKGLKGSPPAIKPNKLSKPKIAGKQRTSRDTDSVMHESDESAALSDLDDSGLIHRSKDLSNTQVDLCSMRVCHPSSHMYFVI